MECINYSPMGSTVTFTVGCDAVWTVSSHVNCPGTAVGNVTYLAHLFAAGAVVPHSPVPTALQPTVKVTVKPSVENKMKLIT